MKKTLLISAITVSILNAYSQELPIDSQTGRVLYEKIIEVDSLSKETIYTKALEWFALKFTSSNDVIQFKDEESGKIIGKGSMKIEYYSREPILSFTITVWIKEGRSKVVLTDFTYLDIQDDSFNIIDFPKKWAGKKRLYEAVDVAANSILLDIEDYIRGNSEKDEWEFRP